MSQASPQIIRSHLPDLPYPGLRAFQQQEWPIFFGRERMVDDVIDLVGERRFVLIHGASGCGKSSLVRAGVMAQLEREHDRRGLRWSPASCMPGSSPLWHLATCLCEATTERRVGDIDPLLIARVRSLFNRGAAGVSDALRLLERSPNQQIFLLIDQFEELFRFADEGGLAEAKDFVVLLRELHDHKPDGVYIALTMRSDHIGDCGRFAGLSEIVNGTHYLVPPMNNSELEDAVREPAGLYGGEVSTALAHRLIEETASSVDQLPLLQHALAYMWRLAIADGKAPRLDIKQLDDPRVRSASQALSAHADDVLTELDKTHPDCGWIVEGLFRALVKVDSAGRAIRRRVEREQASEEIGCTIAQLEPVLEAFGRRERSFIIEERQDPARQPKLDVSHEALLRHWKRLSARDVDESGEPIGWIHRELDDSLRWQSFLATIASGRDETETYFSPPVFKKHKAWWQRRQPTAAWADKHGNQFDGVKQLLQRSQDEAQRAVKMKRGIISVSILLGLVLLGASIIYIQQNQEIREAKTRLESLAQDLSETNSELVKASGELTATNTRLEASTNNLKKVIEGQWDFVRDAATEFEKQGDWDDYVEILVAMEFLPDKASANETRRNWPELEPIVDYFRDAIEGIEVVAEKLVPIPAMQGQVDGVAVSADGRWIATASNEGAVRLIEAADGSEIWSRQFDEGATRIAFSPDGRGLVFGLMDGTVHIVDAATGDARQTMQHGTKRIWGVDWSPLGDLVASSSWEGDVRLWRADDGGLVRTLEGHVDDVNDVAFSPDGTRIASVADDGTMLIHSVVTGEAQAPVKGVGSVGLDWSTAQPWIAIAGGSGISVWHSETLEEVQRIEDVDVGGGSYGVAFSPDGTRLAIGSYDDSVQIWDFATQSVTRSHAFHQDDVDTVAWLPDGRAVLSGSDDGGVYLVRWTERDEMPADLDLQSLMEFAQTTVPRCLDERERSLLRLAAEVPAWCIERRKPPYDAQGRVDRAIELLDDGWEANKAAAMTALREARSRLPTEEDPRQVGTIDLLRSIPASLEDADTDLLSHDDPADMYRRLKIDFESLIDTALEVARQTPEARQEAAASWVKFGTLVRVNGLTPDIRFIATKAFERAIDLAGSIDASSRLAIQRLVENALRESEPTRLGKLADDLVAKGEIGKALGVAMEIEDGSVRRAKLSSIVQLPAGKRSLAQLAQAADGLALTPDGKTVAVASDAKEVMLLELETGKEFGRLSGHENDIDRIAFSPDGTRLISGAEDNLAIIWDVESRRALHRLDGHPNRVWGVAWANDGRYVATSNTDDGVRLWDTRRLDEPGRLIGEAKGSWEVAFSPDGRLVAAGLDDNRAFIWDVESGEPRLELSGHSDSVFAIAFSPDGNRVATGSGDGSVRVWSAETGDVIISFPGADSSVWAVAFSPDGSLLATGNAAGEIRLFRTGNGELVQSHQHADNVDVLAFTPDGRQLLFGADDGMVQMLEVWAIGIDSYIREQQYVCLRPEERRSLGLPDKPRDSGWCRSP